MPLSSKGNACENKLKNSLIFYYKCCFLTTAVLINNVISNVHFALHKMCFGYFLAALGGII
jgi:hypothetical protein